ncbi:sugar phosphate isomerase/epimerase [Anaerobacterium chartisolvens]|uniref:Sugar phosphate isomerase/epimerase n=1 Tax=Anaerobacterium chartisolvens TaxID=1297424 RepID=A0A369AKH5_9FIRM|nr:sugar phosphate isomerase/epimerase family protein [Anaerobacterium chartisolvens]RCX09909.1 sugar phosphate isomerase/epimerase [Anaerobacterium chartisolvens]
MKLGFVSAILGDFTYEEVITYASENGFSCVELMCWPKGKAERRYAGVTHIDVDTLDEKRAAEIVEFAKAKGVEISALGYYPNPLDPDSEKSKVYIDHIKEIIKSANMLGVGTVTSFIGRDKNKTVEENLDLFKAVWVPIIKLAEENNVKIAIENCPMLFTKDEWPGGLNLATTPAIWRKMFELIPSPNFGLNYDPSHFVWQQMDYIKPIYEFKDRIFHVHFKDIKLYKDKLEQVGVMATPLQYMTPKLPGLGDVDWGKFVSALTDIRYRGYACIEVEDKAFEDTQESIKKSIILSRNYMRQFLF